MKKYTLVSLICLLLISGCGTGKAAQPAATATAQVTEVPCPGIMPRGLISGIQAYVTLIGNVVETPLYDEKDGTHKIGSVQHHVQVALKEGPICADSTAWWRISKPDGMEGWMQIGSGLDGGHQIYEAVLEPFMDDAVQREVPENQKQEAQIRYIVADIELGGVDVLKYYQDQVAARPDDPETVPMKAAIEIINAGSGRSVLANAGAFERKPLRGGTSVVDAGTEFVQPGLDVLLLPCDGSDTPAAVCESLIK